MESERMPAICHRLAMTKADASLAPLRFLFQLAGFTSARRFSAVICGVVHTLSPESCSRVRWAVCVLFREMSL